MTWPVASEGYYVSSEDPTVTHQCLLGAKKPDNAGPNPLLRGMACPGGNPKDVHDFECAGTKSQIAELMRRREVRVRE